LCNEVIEPSGLDGTGWLVRRPHAGCSQSDYGRPAASLPQDRVTLWKYGASLVFCEGKSVRTQGLHQSIDDCARINPRRLDAARNHDAALASLH
jgi:hypothetical protein